MTGTPTGPSCGPEPQAPRAGGPRFPLFRVTNWRDSQVCPDQALLVFSVHRVPEMGMPFPKRPKKEEEGLLGCSKGSLYCILVLLMRFSSSDICVQKPAVFDIAASLHHTMQSPVRAGQKQGTIPPPAHPKPPTTHPSVHRQGHVPCILSQGQSQCFIAVRFARNSILRLVL